MIRINNRCTAAAVLVSAVLATVVSAGPAQAAGRDGGPSSVGFGGLVPRLGDKLDDFTWPVAPADGPGDFTWSAR
ncbi:hypothetical protein [Streptomyces sp. NPDC059134]|uniref:hypothetical protein n=1 Tax=Streptomyces sp. NPDC059134 TaxID=3346738 RepID=UPI0036C5F79A